MDLIIILFDWHVIRERPDQQFLVSAISASSCSCSYEMTVHLVLPWKLFLEYPGVYYVWHENGCFGGLICHRMAPRSVVMYQTLCQSILWISNLPSLLFATEWVSSVPRHGSCPPPLFTNRRSNWRQNRRATQVGNLCWYLSERHSPFLLFLCIWF